jgi:hypothetical protein
VAEGVEGAEEAGVDIMASCMTTGTMIRTANGEVISSEFQKLFRLKSCRLKFKGHKPVQEKYRSQMSIFVLVETLNQILHGR